VDEEGHSDFGGEGPGGEHLSVDGAADVPPHVAVLVRQDDASDVDGEPFRPAHGAEALGAGAAPLPPPLPLAASGTLRAGSKATSDAETLAYLLKPGLLPSVQFYGVLQQVRFPTHPLLLPSLPPPLRTSARPPFSYTLTTPSPHSAPSSAHPSLPLHRRVFSETGTTSSANTSLPTSPRFRLPWLPTRFSPLTPCATTYTAAPLPSVSDRVQGSAAARWKGAEPRVWRRRGGGRVEQHHPRKKRGWFCLNL
jgi:hypothetical protein